MTAGDGAVPSASERIGADRDRRGRVHDTVLRDLVDEIVSGRIPPRSALPTEADLCARLGVSRPALREVLRHLAARGLVRPRKRLGTMVLDPIGWDYLDPVVIAATLRHARGGTVLRELFEARRILEPEAAGLAAERASAAEVAVIEEAFGAMMAADSRGHRDWSEADLAFHTAVFEASHNWVLRQFVHAIRAALLASFELTNRFAPSHERALALHGAVLEAIRLRRPDEAREATRYLIDISSGEMEEAVRRLGPDGVPAPDRPG